MTPETLAQACLRVCHTPGQERTRILTLAIARGVSYRQLAALTGMSVARLHAITGKVERGRALWEAA